MAGQCELCGARLSLLGRLKGLAICGACANDQTRERDEATRRYRELLISLGDPTTDLTGFGAQLDTLAAHSRLDAPTMHAMQGAALKVLVESWLEDDRLTVAEEDRLFGVAEALGFNQAQFGDAIGELLPRLIVARANDGRLEALKAVELVLKRGELAYVQLKGAVPLQEKVLKEWQAGSTGVSFRIAKGVRFSTARTHGRMVEIGTYLAPVDIGTLTLTSQRVVFVGSKRSIEVPYKKLLSMDVFSDGIRLHQSGRSAPPLFKLAPGWGNGVAATVNSAMQSTNYVLD